MVERARFGRHGGCRRDAVSGLGAIGVPIVHAINRIADVQHDHLLADRGNQAGKFVALDDGKRSWISILGFESGKPLKFRGRDGGGVDLDQHLAATGPGPGNFAKHQFFVTGQLVQIYGFHFLLLAWQQETLFNPFWQG